MGSVAKKKTDYSIWDSVVNDKIIQMEELDRKYRCRGREVEKLKEENEILKADREEISMQLAAMQDKLAEKEAQIRRLDQETANLRQWIDNMENSTCWKMTKPIRVLTDRIRKH